MAKKKPKKSSADEPIDETPEAVEEVKEEVTDAVEAEAPEADAPETEAVDTDVKETVAEPVEATAEADEEEATDTVEADAPEAEADAEETVVESVEETAEADVAAVDDAVEADAHEAEEAEADAEETVAEPVEETAESDSEQPAESADDATDADKEEAPVIAAVTDDEVVESDTELTLGSAEGVVETHEIVQPQTIRGKVDKFGTAIGTGRRKTSVARVRVKDGNGQLTINGRSLDEYFQIQRDRNLVVAPLKATDSMGNVDVWVRVNGGGTTGQAGAIVLGIARALQVRNPDLHHTLSSGGYLSRDGRMVERKKYGYKKARKSFQFSKR